MKLSALKELRKGKRINQTKFATDLGITQPYLSQIEGGKRIPSLELLEDICEKLDCELRIIPKT